MTEQNRYGDGEVACTVRTLIERLDAAATFIEEKEYLKARERLYGRRWLTNVDVDGVPIEVLKRAQQWIDATHDALTGSDPDVSLARNTLFEARRVISG